MALARARSRWSVHQSFESLLVDAQVVLGDQLEGQVDREAVGVVQEEGVGGGDPFVAGLAGALDQLVEPLQPLLERAPERLFLGLEPLAHDVALAVQFRILGAHQLGHHVRRSGSGSPAAARASDRAGSRAA